MGSPVVFVDVDDTLVRSVGSKRIPMSAMVDLVSELKKSGAVLYCWSTGGASYAESSAAELGLSGCFTGYLPKPQLMLDDVAIKNWKLVEMHPAECASQTAAELLSRICR